MVHVAQQLGVMPNALVAYGNRAQTRTEHFQEIQAYLGFQPAGAKELRALARWLVKRALEHDKLKLLLQLSCDRLFVQKIVRPGITVRSYAVETEVG